MTRRLMWIGFVAASSVGFATTPVTANAAEANLSPPASDVESHPDEAQTDSDVTILPAPLDRVVSDIDQIEQTGFFKVERVERGRTEDYEEDTTVWTVRVLRPMTCRHALMLLQHYRDVRFYDTDHGTHRELANTLLYYSLRLDMGAVDDQLLDPGERFQVWILLSRREIQRLVTQGADTVEFRRWKWR